MKKAFHLAYKLADADVIMQVFLDWHVYQR